MTEPNVPDLPELRPADDRCLSALGDLLAPGRVHRELSRRRDASRDYAWISPVLARRLPDVLPDAVVTLRTPDELASVLGLAFRHGVAVTARGRGTGNYGQAVPLAAGIVIDTGQLQGVLDIGHGWMQALAGTSFTRLEAAARMTGQELAMFPSTTASALAGFLGGGAGGAGSIENGFIWDGFVQSLELLPCWDVPEATELDGREALAHLHSYGTTGVITSARIALRPARRWTALFASFASFDAAVAAAELLLVGDPAPRSLCIDDAALVEYLGTHRGVPADRISLRAIVDVSTLADAKAAVVQHGGVVEAVDSGSCSLLVSLSFNHVTLRAKRARPELCHVQVGGPALIARHEEIRAIFPGGMLHLDAMRGDDGPGFGGLLLSAFVDEGHLSHGVEALRSIGVCVIDAHSWAVGGHGSLDPILHAAERFDPAGLLNPGKLARRPLSRARSEPQAGPSAPR